LARLAAHLKIVKIHDKNSPEKILPKNSPEKWSRFFGRFLLAMGTTNELVDWPVGDLTRLVTVGNLTAFPTAKASVFASNHLLNLGTVGGMADSRMVCEDVGTEAEDHLLLLHDLLAKLFAIVACVACRAQVHVALETSGCRLLLLLVAADAEAADRARRRLGLEDVNLVQSFIHHSIGLESLVVFVMTLHVLDDSRNKKRRLTRMTSSAIL